MPHPQGPPGHLWGAVVELWGFMPQRTLGHSPSGLLELLAPSAAPWPAQGLKPSVNDEYMLLSHSSWASHFQAFLCHLDNQKPSFFFKCRLDLMKKLNCRKNSTVQEPLLACLLESRSWSFQKIQPVPEKEEKWPRFYSQSCLFSSAETWGCTGVLCASRALRGLQSCCLCTEGFLSFNLALLENVLLIPVVILLCVISLHYLVQKMKTKRRF